MAESEVNIPGYIPGQGSTRRIPWLILLIITCLVIILPSMILFKDKSLRILNVAPTDYLTDMIIKGRKAFIIEKHSMDYLVIKEKDISSGKEIIYKIEENEIETYFLSEDGLRIYFTKENSHFLFFQELNSKSIVSKINIIKPIEGKFILDDTSIFLCFKKDIQISPDNKYLAFNICNSKIKSKFIVLNLEINKVVYIGQSLFKKSKLIFRWIDNNNVLIYDIEKQESKIVDLLRE